MSELTIAPLAREDLKGIGRYTRNTWGVTQRDAYLTEFADIFEKLRIGVSLGRSRNEVRENLLSHSCRKHIIFFRRDAHGNVEILRILHERMDFDRHL